MLEYFDQMPTAPHGLTRASVVALTLVAALLGAGCGAKVPPKVSSTPPQAAPVVQAPVQPVEQAVVTPEPAPPAPAQTVSAATQPVPQEKSEPAPIDELLAITTTESPTVRPDIEKTVAQDLETDGHDIEIPLNDRVLSYVELFTGRLKGYLEEGLGRGARFLPMIQDVFRAEGIPLDLAYVPLIESAFKPNALSRAKAKGIWQFMRGTAL